MATVPLSGTNIALYSGIPFNSDYKHTRWFESLADQLNWFASQTHVATVSQSNFQRIEGRPFFRVNMSIDQLWNVNYFSFQNADYNKVFYAFVTKLEYVQANATNVHFEIDVVQTWRFDMDFKPSFVVREHCPLWNSDGTPVVNTVPEDLHYGSEYETVYINNIQPNDGWKWLVVICKSTIHAQDGTTTGIGVSFPVKSIIPTVIGTPQPLSVYLVPFQTNDTVPTVTLSDGTQPQVTKPSKFLRGLYLSDNAVNNVVSIYVTDHTGIGITSTTSSITFNQNNNEIIPASFTDSEGNTNNCLYVQSVWSFDQLSYYAGSKYLGYKSVTESKLMMYPYTVLILDDFKGSRSTFRNEYIEDPNLTLTIKGSLGTSNKTTYGIQAYNKDPNTQYSSNVTDETALINNNPNDVAILDDNLAAFLQGHRNTLMNQKAYINFNAGADIAGSGIAALSSAMSGNALGAGASAVNGVKGAGNSVLALQGILAKEKDIANTPPQITKMGSNTSYDFGNGYNGLYIVKKQIKDEYIKKLTDFFNMYGYKLNEVKIPNFHTRASWNYVQTVDCVIRANINNEDLDELKSVFDNGITLWHVDDIGNYTLSNGVIA